MMNWHAFAPTPSHLLALHHCKRHLPEVAHARQLCAVEALNRFDQSTRSGDPCLQPLVLWNSMHARAQEPAGANEARPDSPIDMHRDESRTDAQQSRPGGSEASGSGAEPCRVPAAPVQRTAQLMGRRLKVSISLIRFPRLSGWVVCSWIDV